MIGKNAVYTGVFLALMSCCTGLGCCIAQSRDVINASDIITGAERTGEYIPLINDRKVGLVANQTTVIGRAHLLDSLLDLGIHIRAVFSPEHGFRGNADAGALVDGSVDPNTGVPVISLYGSNRKPSGEDLNDIDVVIYDIQDIGARFYTYISTLHYVMEACAENHIPLIVLDRPNPNGHYVDGPVLEPSFRSFVGMHPIPVVHGMTIGEFARMINGEGWLQGSGTCDLTVIPCRNYAHNSIYNLPVNPSPNITSMEAVYLYPSLCFFEGTVMNVGRGTDNPFRVFGHPGYPDQSFSYTPGPNTGNANPMHNGLPCFGGDLTGLSADNLHNMGRVNLGWLMAAYESMNLGADFFNGYFNTLAGNDRLKAQILAGWTEDLIRKSWQAGLESFMEIRRKYLLYE